MRAYKTLSSCTIIKISDCDEVPFITIFKNVIHISYVFFIIITINAKACKGMTLTKTLMPTPCQEIKATLCPVALTNHDSRAGFNKNVSYFSCLLWK